MTYDEVMQELSSLGNAQTKKTYMNHGVKEPLFGVRSGDLKPLYKKIKKDHDLAMKLFASGNYDAMYFSGMIVDPKQMKESDFDHWMKSSYCHMIADYIVSLTLAQCEFGEKVALRYIQSDSDLYKSAGWCCFDWMISMRKDETFNIDSLKGMLKDVEENIHQQSNRTRYAMNSFVMAVGISYLPLYDVAIRVASKIGSVQVDMGNTSCNTPNALAYILKAKEKGRLGYKRKYTHC